MPISAKFGRGGELRGYYGIYILALSQMRRQNLVMHYNSMLPSESLKPLATTVFVHFCPKHLRFVEAFII